MIMEGKAHRFGRDINTDYITAVKHRAKTTEYKGLAVYLMDDIRPGFYDEIEPGNFIVADENFGCGSSREYAPRVIKAAGIAGVLAKSFARIFYRNSINLGLPVITCDTSLIKEGDSMIIDLDSGKVVNADSNITIEIAPFPHQMQELLKEGGIVNYIKKYEKFPE